MRRPAAVLIAAAFLFVPFAANADAAAAARGATPGRADTSRVHLGAADTGTDAFVAWPAGAGPAPAVVVAHEWWGLNTQIREVARQLAREGYVAIVPDLYHGRVADDPERAHTILRGVDEDDATADMTAAVTWLRAQPRTAKSRIAALGFCFGGRMALLLGLRSRELSAVIVFYGTPVLDAERLAPLDAPLLGHFGATDEGIPPAKVEAFRAALAKAGKTAEVYEYPGAGHAFMHEGRESYHRDAARQAWARTLAFLQRRLKG